MTQHAQITISLSYPCECLNVGVAVSWARRPFSQPHSVAKVAHWPASNERGVPGNDKVGIAESRRRLRYLPSPTADFQFLGPRQQQRTLQV